MPDIERRLPEYLGEREKAEVEPFLGIASDGLKWIVFELRDGVLVRLRETTLDPEQPDVFIAWLDGAVALKTSLPPEALTVRAELGRDSVAYIRAERELRAIWETHHSKPAIALKHQVWAGLLRLVQGSEPEQQQDLWLQHTFLVIVAKCIALAVLEVDEPEPEHVLSGEALRSRGISGAVESDFFDWIVAMPEGRALVRRIMAHVRRFRLKEVESDVLKVLYESLIDRAERHGLGEYYTPDWLAAKVVRHSVERPIQDTVLDPACGSGTFLFHAIRRFLNEAEDADMPMEDRAVEATRLVIGTDIHPVAVIIARVTYLLALGRVLGNREGTISVPVYLGDAMQLSVSEIIKKRDLQIHVPAPPKELQIDVPAPAGQSRSGDMIGSGRETLDFPETFCAVPDLFDAAIAQLQRSSEAGHNREQVEMALTRITKDHLNSIRTLHTHERRFTEEQELAIKDLGQTYLKFHKLRVEGRDTIWAYVARNLSRPLFLSARNGWASVLIGNPPWVAFRHMSDVLQRRFKELARDERVYVGGKLATQNDLFALFTVRAAALYLRPAGRLAFVLPMAALTRGQYAKFQSGSFTSVKLG
ncbi:MAG: N-6 DNA methylase [Pseudomonadota bacterium]